MHGLSDDEIALANHGKISAALRARSPIYYWQKSGQEQSRHEAVCEKRGRWHLITFGSHARFAELARRKCAFAKQRRQMRNAVDSCTEHNQSTLPADYHGGDAKKGAGWWRWKPFLLLRKLREVDEGDIVAHLDYDLIMDVRPNALFCLGQNAPNGIALFHMPCLTERAWTKKECSDALNATEEMLDSVQIYAGMVIVRKSASSMRFVEEWLRHTASDLVTENMQMAIQHSTFVQHRHDQSILSILSKRHLLKSYPFPTRAHDVRDVWAWDAGYCSPEGFDWPLPFFRSHLFFGFVTHYKEFGHQRDSARMCHKVQGPSAPVPLTDYLESKRTFNEMLRDEQLAKDMQKRRITGRSLRNGTSGDRCLVKLLVQESKVQTVKLEGKRGGKGGSGERVFGRCVENQTYGGFVYTPPPNSGVGGPFPHLWVNHGCRGVFRCAGVDVRCGRPGREGRKLVVCACSQLSSLEYGRHWNDGAL